MVLTEKLFQGIWETQFNKNNTQDKDYHVNSNETIQVPTMQVKSKFKYADNSDIDAQVTILVS